MRWIDTHAHLDDERLVGEFEALVARACQVGVDRIIAVGTSAARSRHCVELAQRSPHVFAAVGIQPNDCNEVEPGDWDQIVAMVTQPRVVAIGETGLDCYWDKTPLDLQREYFTRHLDLARQSELPFIVHMRDSGEPIVAMLEAEARNGPLRGVMHSFTGDEDLAQRCLDLGMYISFAGMITFNKSDDLRQVAAMVPYDRLLIETDAPYLSPHPMRGKFPNEPSRVVHTAACVANVRGMTLDQLAQVTTRNAETLFRFGPSPPLDRLTGSRHTPSS